MSYSIKENYMNKIFELTKNNAYIKNYTQNLNKDLHSLSYLIKKEHYMSQSDCIKFGIAIEKVLSDIILEFNKDILSIKTKNEKNKKERDHLFINNDTKTIYYSELKSNLNLDTEKSKSTYLKCLKIVEELNNEYPGYTIKWCLLGLRYYTKDIIDNKILSKYSSIKNNVYGVNEYLNLFDIDIQFNEQTYTDFINCTVNEMLN